MITMKLEGGKLTSQIFWDITRDIKDRKEIIKTVIKGDEGDNTSIRGTPSI